MKPALALIDKAGGATRRTGTGAAAAAASTARRLPAIIGHPGEQTGAVYKITIGRPDIHVREQGARSTRAWASTRGRRSPGPMPTRWSPATSRCSKHEVTPVLKALRANGIDVVAIHHHMTGVRTGGDLPALLRHGAGRRSWRKGVRAAVDVLGHVAAGSHNTGG